jgi:cytoskeletal protein RodZ
MPEDQSASAMIHKPTEEALSKNQKIEIKRPKHNSVFSILFSILLYFILFAVSVAIVYFVYGHFNKPPEFISPVQ